ncbi:hypothetical protein BKA61DRAFT_282709 [Leptodontidium sp. MPI-SDFR-AT-0119]|nr:hypothetical protein BKA61DRAFT_282709 [Leptodontidium sp. MPI-SDFR-AT-0119]
MKTLLVYIGVFSPFTNIISCFGFEKGPNQDGRGGFYDRTSTTGLVLETAYTLKHVEHKAGSAIPFSIRQMGIYQNFNLATKTSSNILIQSSQNVQREVLRLVQEGTMATFPDHWKNVHEIHLSSLSNNWIDYIKFLESKMSDIEDAVRFAKRDTPDRVTFETLQRLSKYRDIMIRIAHTLDANIAALNKLLALARKRQKKCESKEPAEEDESFSESIQTCIVEQEMLKHHVGLVESSSQELGALVRNTITLTDGNVMLTLTQKTIQEARTMRTITFIALIYLPASFTSTFLSMGFVHVESLDGIMRLNVSKDMLFYVAITVPLMVVTISAWWLWEYMSKRRKRISREEGDEEKAKDL